MLLKASGRSGKRKERRTVHPWKLLERDDLDAQTLEDVAAALQRLVTWNEEELALEGALTKSRISPCLAVRSEGMVTVVTEKESLSEGESALLLTLCEAHTGVSPEGVKVICTGSETKIGKNRFQMHKDGV